jgi:hypothetical protein
VFTPTLPFVHGDSISVEVDNTVKTYTGGALSIPDTTLQVSRYWSESFDTGSLTDKFEILSSVATPGMTISQQAESMILDSTDATYLKFVNGINKTDQGVITINTDLTGATWSDGAGNSSWTPMLYGDLPGNFVNSGSYNISKRFGFFFMANKNADGVDQGKITGFRCFYVDTSLTNWSWDITTQAWISGANLSFESSSDTATGKLIHEFDEANSRWRMGYDDDLLSVQYTDWINYSGTLYLDTNTIFTLLPLTYTGTFDVKMTIEDVTYGEAL